MKNYKISDEEVATLNFVSGYIQAQEKDKEDKQLNQFLKLVYRITKESGLK